MCVYKVGAYILIGPSGGRALTGNAHTGALFATTAIVTLEIVESQFTAVAVLSLYIFLHEREKDQQRERERERETEKER